MLLLLCHSLLLLSPLLLLLLLLLLSLLLLLLLLGVLENVLLIFIFMLSHPAKASLPTLVTEIGKLCGCKARKLATRRTNCAPFA